MKRLLLVCATILVTAACSKPTPAADKPSDACVKDGQQCVFAPGKLGLCTAPPGAPDACDGGPCLTCMSLH